MHRLVQAHWYRREEPLAVRLLLAPLWLVSLLVASVAARRRARFGRPGAARRVGARVVSVGNLTVGGAGKTPVAVEIARRLHARGERPAVLSRGYGRKERGPLVVSDGTTILADARAGGDEPLVIARALPEVPVLVGPDRAALAALAVERFGARSLVLDDGFQHLRLARDLDIVVVDASNPFGNGHPMPRGPLREGRAALRAAGLGWISKADQADPREVERLAQELRAATGREPVRSAYRVSGIADLDGAEQGTDCLRGKRVLLLAGLARPESFRRTLESCGAQIAGEAIFPDHHRFTDAELREVAESAGRLGAEAVALTAKDAARLGSARLAVAARVVHVELQILAGEQSLAEAL
jgi:tetraacyldisaccharide 4'-kinase